MRVRFWGTRGSIPKPGPGTVRYGGNTACVEVRSAGGTLVVLDCGTGAHGLGVALMAAAAGKPIRGHLLISHTHWDHIQGIPFFAPFFVPGNEWDIYAPRGLARSIRETLAGQMQYTYFPVALEQLGATIRYHDLMEGSLRIGDVEVRTQYLNHPALTLGYRLEADGASFVYASDHEPYARRLASGTGEFDGQDRRHADFLAGADMVLHDAQFTTAEYPSRLGWGHSTIDYAVAVAKLAGVKRLALSHHDPMRDDDALDALVEDARTRLVPAPLAAAPLVPGDPAAAGGAAADGTPLEVFAAAEGAVVELGNNGAAADGGPAAGAAATEEPPALVGQVVLVVTPEQRTADALAGGLGADGVCVFRADDAAGALTLLASERPSLVVIARRLPGGVDGLDVCRAVRSAATAKTKDVPVVLIAKQEDVTAGEAAAGVTDWLVEPFSPEFARARVQSWLLRGPCRWVRAPLPPGEAARLAAVRQLGLLDAPPDERFDRITRLAAAALDVPVALVSLVDEDRQWLTSCVGIAERETPRDVSFCAHAILDRGVMVIPDALLDPRFADNPIVTGPPHVRFYAGCPLVMPGGAGVGTLCVIDTRPRQFDEAAVRLLEDLAKLARQEMIAVSAEAAAKGPAGGGGTTAGGGGAAGRPSPDGPAARDGVGAGGGPTAAAAAAAPSGRRSVPVT